MPTPHNGHSSAITIALSGVLRDYCNGASDLSLASARTVRDALRDVERLNAPLYQSVCDETGAVRRHVGVFVNEDHIRDRAGLDTPLEPGDVVSLLPAVSGG
jgi:molybdopterin synthase sulfur carrier subunit